MVNFYTKIYTNCYDAIREGRQTCLIRRGNYNIGDVLILQEYDFIERRFINSRNLYALITHVTNKHLEEGYVCLSLSLNVNADLIHSGIEDLE